MLDLLYLSHTVVPSHLAELESLGLLEPDEQVLVALDGVLLEGAGRRVSGPTLHDYCLLTSKRVLLWARDYGRHLCYAFPLTELCKVEGVGLDPIHAHVHFAFAAPGEEEQYFTLTLLPLVDLPAAVTLFRLAADTAQTLVSQGVDPGEVGFEIAALMSEQIFGVEGDDQPGTPYRWAGGDDAGEPGGPMPNGANPPWQQDVSGLPPEQVYSISRMGRAAWDTVNRALRDAELPFNLNGGDVRDVAEAMRALNDLLTTVAGNQGAREVVMAFLRRRAGESDSFTPQPPPGQSAASASSAPTAHPSASMNAEEYEKQQEPPGEEGEGGYHEIPLRRRGDSPRVVLQPAPLTSERGDTIPLRRRGGERQS